MNRSGKWFVLAVDVLGAGVVAGCLLVGVWLTFVRGDTVDDEIQRLKRTIGGARRDVSMLRAERDRQKVLLAEHEEQLADRGRLPTHSPTEKYFQALSNLAGEHGLRVVRHNPLSQRSYPGLLEQRYAYEVHGAMPDLARFFKAIEEADYWADVSYLRIVNSQGGDGGDRVAMLTISVFSAQRGDAPSEDG